MSDADRSDMSKLLGALRHPLRREILRLMAEREPTSPRELSTTLSQPLSNVSYHVRVLASCGALELVGTKQVRGSMQHFYRPARRPDWAQFVLATEDRQTSNNRAQGE